MPDFAQLAIKVHGASNLPNADVLSKTDGYVKVTVGCARGKNSQRTATISDSLNPAWEQVLNFDVPIDPAVNMPCTSVTLEVWDENVFKDCYMGTVTVHLSPEHFRPGAALEFPIKFTKPKWLQTRSFLRLNFSWVRSFDQLLTSYPATFGDRANHHLYLPLSFAPVVLGIEYKPDTLDIRLLVTQPQRGLYLDMVLRSATSHRTKLHRREVKSGEPFYANMVFYEELKLVNVPFWEDLSQLQIIVMTKKLEESVNLNTVVSKHGWKGSMSWDMASKLLRDVELDTVQQEVFIPMPGSFFVVDWDEDDVDMKCYILDIPENGFMAYDLNFSGPDVRKTSEVFTPSKVVLGKYNMQRKVELDDVPFGTALRDIVWHRYSLAAVWQGALFELLPLR